MIFINFKTYKTGSGEDAVRMAKVVEGVSRETGIEMAVVVPVMEVAKVAAGVLVPVYAQHVDGVGYGAHTGWILPESVKQAGAVGVLLNHSEHKIEKREIVVGKNRFELSLENSVTRAKEVGLKVLVCGANEDEVKDILELEPDYVAYEPPELIGGKVSVSSAKPEVVAEVVEKAGQEKVLIGAGVNSTEDIKVGLELGAVGFLIASAVMRADDPEAALRELVEGYS